MAFKTAANILFKWFEHNDVNDVGVSVMDELAGFLRSGKLKANAGNLTKTFTAFDKKLIEQGYREGTDELKPDTLRFMRDTCRHGGAELNDWASIVEARLLKVENEWRASGVNQGVDHLLGDEASVGESGKTPVGKPVNPEKSGGDSIGYDVNHEIEDVVDLSSSSDESESRVRTRSVASSAVTRTKVSVPTYSKGTLMADHVDRFDLFVARAKVPKEYHELYFVDSFSKCQEYGDIFDGMRMDEKETSFEELVLKFVEQMDRLDLSKVLARRDRISQMRNEQGIEEDELFPSKAERL